MPDNRRIQQRNEVFAKAVLLGVQVPGYVRNMNSGGLRVDWVTPPGITGGQEAKIQIIPTEELDLSAVEATVQFMWLRQAGIYTSSGLKLVVIKNREMLEDYKKLLNYFSEHS